MLSFRYQKPHICVFPKISSTFWRWSEKPEIMYAFTLTQTWWRLCKSCLTSLTSWSILTIFQSWCFYLLLATCLKGMIDLLNVFKTAWRLGIRQCPSPATCGDLYWPLRKSIPRKNWISWFNGKLWPNFLINTFDKKKKNGIMWICAKECLQTSVSAATRTSTLWHPC